jgi:transcriptional regulator with XRE-family HTH domain
MPSIAPARVDRRPTQGESFGRALRRCRAERGVSQLDLSMAAGVSTRHISFLECGKARPSQPMVLTIGRTLAVPAEELDRLLYAAGFAPLSWKPSLPAAASGDGLPAGVSFRPGPSQRGSQ